jgi:hypothetical protein
LYGLEAIRASNGWAMAVAGALIVMLGLSVLSFVISQLHKVLALLEKRSQPAVEKTDLKPTAIDQPDYDPERPFLNLVEAVKHYRNATQDLGESFELKDLYTIFYHSGFPHPHLTIRSLRENGYLVPGGEGYYSWKD